MKLFPKTVFLTLILLLLITLIWVLFSIALVLGYIPSVPSGFFQLFMSFLSMGCALCLGGVTWFLSRRYRLAYFFLVSLLGMIAVAFLMDDFGVADLIFLSVHLVVLGLLIKDRDWYLLKSSPS